MFFVKLNRLPTRVCCFTQFRSCDKRGRVSRICLSNDAEETCSNSVNEITRSEVSDGSCNNNGDSEDEETSGDGDVADDKDDTPLCTYATLPADTFRYSKAFLTTSGQFLMTTALNSRFLHSDGRANFQ